VDKIKKELFDCKHLNHLCKETINEQKQLIKELLKISYRVEITYDEAKIVEKAENVINDFYVAEHKVCDVITNEC